MRLIQTSLILSLITALAFGQSSGRGTADTSKQPGNPETVGATGDPKNRVGPLTKSADTDLRTGDSRTGADAGEEGDRRFVTNAAEGGHAEIGLAQLALTKSSNARVKSYAQMLQKDHTHANKELMNLAKKNGVDLLAAGKGGDQSHPAPDGGAAKLAAASGTDFDRLYISRQVDDHKKAIDLFEHESKNGRNADIKQFAGRTLPTLRAHLAQAEALQAGLK